MSAHTDHRPVPAMPLPRLAALYANEAWLELLKLLRTPAFAAPTLAFPLAFYVFFGLVLPGQWSGLDRPTFLLATYGVFGVMGPALFGFGVGLAMERENGLLALKRVSPMPIAAYFTAKIAMSLVFALAVVLLLSAAAVWGGGVRIAPGRWSLLVAVLLVGTLPFCAMGLWIGALARGQAAVAIVNLVYLPMAVLSGLWIPLMLFPPLLQALAPVWPAWHLSQLALGVVGQAQSVPWAWHLAVLLLFTVMFLALAAARLESKGER